MEENSSKKVIFWTIPTKIVLGGLTLLLALSFLTKYKFGSTILVISCLCILICLIQFVLFFLILGKKNYSKEERKKFYNKQLNLILIHTFFSIISANAIIPMEKPVENEVSYTNTKAEEKPKKQNKKYRTVEYGWVDSLGAGGFFIKYKKEVNSINLEELVQTNFEDHIKITNYETKDIIAIAPMYANATISPSAIANIVHSKYEQRSGGYYFFNGENMARLDESYGKVYSFWVRQGECFIYYHKKDGKLEDTYNLIIDSIKCNNPTIKNK